MKSGQDGHLQKITDEELLFWIRTKILILRDGEVWKFQFRRFAYRKLKTQQWKGRDRFQLISGSQRFGTRRSRTIQANKLIWMIEHQKIPNGDIDHKNGDRTDNRAKNLRDRCPIENRRDNTLQGYNECVDFFHRKLAEQYGSKGDF